MRKCIYDVDVDFFKNWNSKMAYVLGFIFSDGSVHKTTLSIEVRLSDKELLEKIQNAMKSNYPIKSFERRNSAWIRISNPYIIRSLEQLGFAPRKPIAFFPMPPHLLKHFARGFLDGDGWIISNRKRFEICVGFSNGNREFLEELVKELNKHILFTNNHLRRKEKVTRKNRTSITYQIEWYGTNAYNLIKFLYDNLKDDDLYLERKYKRQLEARNIYSEIRKGKMWRNIEHEHGMSMGKLLSKLLIKEGRNGVEIAKELGVSSASVYRLLEKTRVRLPTEKKAKKFITTCPVCGKRIEHPKRLKKYCSKHCELSAKRKGKIVKCTVCGKKIYRPNWWFKSNVASLCSRRCFGEWQKMRLQSGSIHRSKKTGRFLPSIPLKEECPA